MPLNTDRLTAHMQAQQAHLPQTATVGGVVLACTRVAMRAQDVAARQADFAADYRISLAFVTADLQATDGPGDTLSFAGTTYRILTSEVSPDGLETRFHLGAQYTAELR